MSEFPMHDTIAVVFRDDRSAGRGWKLRLFSASNNEVQVYPLDGTELEQAVEDAGSLIGQAKWKLTERSARADVKLDAFPDRDPRRVAAAEEAAAAAETGESEVMGQEFDLADMNEENEVMPYEGATTDDQVAALGGEKAVTKEEFKASKTASAPYWEQTFTTFDNTPHSWIYTDGNESIYVDPAEGMGQEGSWILNLGGTEAAGFGTLEEMKAAAEAEWATGRRTQTIAKTASLQDQIDALSPTGRAVFDALDAVRLRFDPKDARWWGTLSDHNVGGVARETVRQLAQMSLRNIRDKDGASEIDSYRHTLQAALDAHEAAGFRTAEKKNQAPGSDSENTERMVDVTEDNPIPLESAAPDHWVFEFGDPSFGHHGVIYSGPDYEQGIRQTDVVLQQTLYELDDVTQPEEKEKVEAIRDALDGLSGEREFEALGLVWSVSKLPAGTEKDASISVKRSVVARGDEFYYNRDDSSYLVYRHGTRWVSEGKARDGVVGGDVVDPAPTVVIDKRAAFRRITGSALPSDMSSVEVEAYLSLLDSDDEAVVEATKKFECMAHLLDPIRTSSLSIPQFEQLMMQAPDADLTVAQGLRLIGDEFSGDPVLAKAVVARHHDLTDAYRLGADEDFDEEWAGAILSLAKLVG